MTAASVQSVFIAVIILVIYWFYYMLAKPPKMEHRRFDSVNFKTGDIILFHAYDNINPVFIGSYWGHIGIVFRDPDNPHAAPVLFEALRTSKMKQCPDRIKHGIAVTDLKTRLSKYRGLIAYKELNRAVDSRIVRGFKELMHYAYNNMSYNDEVITNGLNKKTGEPLNNSTNCGEIVFLSLIKLGLLPVKDLEKNIAHHLLYAAKLTELQNNCYHEPVELTFNRF